MGNRFPTTGQNSLGAHVLGEKIKTLILQGAEYKRRNSARAVKMLHFPQIH